MKISYRTNSAIKFIEDGDFLNVELLPEDCPIINKMGVPFHFKKSCHNFKEIKIITQPFYEAMEIAIGKILKSDLLYLEYADCGTFVFKNSHGIVETYCYDFHIKDAIVNRCIFFYFQGSQLYKYYNSENDAEYVMSGIPKADPGSSIKNQLNWLFEFFLFTKYAEVQTQELKPNSKHVLIKCKYVNDTSSHIKILDSTWFTNLVKSDTFRVRGHLRLQPYKNNGNWDYKWIWIKDYQKEGYTRKAGIFKEENKAA